ncbi:MAG TPA: hypothetical protein VK967_04885 [Methylotenera sp.]|nr:hypothetical protein [Methylotenera sp.]
MGTDTFLQVSTPPKGMRCLTMFRLAGICGLMLWSASAHAISEISIKAGHIEHPQGAAQNASLTLNLNQSTPTLSLKTALKQKIDKDWVQISLTCNVPKNIQAGQWDCAQGQLKTARIDVPFSIQINRLFTKGSPDISAELQLKNASFSDEAGLHAAEKFTGSLNIAAKQTGPSWAWQTTLDWQTGEVFWQPLYMASGGHRFVASGKLDDDLLSFDSANLQIKSVGQLDFNGQIRISDRKLINLNANLPSMDLATAYPLLFKPFLERTAFNNAEVEGKVSLKVEVKNTELKSFDLRLNDVDMADKNQKFAFYKVNANIPWSYDEPKNVNFAYESGELLNLPLGKTNITAEVNRYALTSPNIRLPILDSALNLSDISATHVGGEWYWHLRAKLEPISMADFSTSLKLPRMQGQASAEIPLVTYANGKLTTDGSVVLNVFHGTATVTQLTMQEPLGKTPKLNADIVLRNLDLGDLTRTFSFGAIEGKLDGDIAGLQMQNWKPVKFDAVVKSSPGKYPKKISQRAVENISALGGAGAAAAVQRSFLRFFEEFNYSKMGLSCKLRNDICIMGGIESTPQGYVIVKGSGIPAITVMGYNQTVGWAELISRIKRVTDGNTKAIVK